MICKYCHNKVTPDSRLANFGVYVECANVDKEGNRMQVEMGKGYFDTKRNIVSLSDCKTMAEVFRFMAKEAKESRVYSGLILKDRPEEIQDLALSYLGKTILFERKKSLLTEREKLLT